MNLARLLDNRTPMAAACLPADDRRGREVLLVIAKMTWSVSAQGAVTIASPQSPVRHVDEPSFDAVSSSVRYPSDYAAEKPGTDLLMVGTAHPRGAPAMFMDVSLRLEAGARTVSKVVRVVGPRTFVRTGDGVVPGSPGPLRPTPLVYERAFGGADAGKREPRNPVGRGFSLDSARLAGTPAPELEDPRAPLTSLSPAPACFGPVSSGWAPRAAFAGTRDDAWRAGRAPLAPLDFDPRFHCVAPPDLWTAAPLSGDEPVEILGATPEGAWRFRLPRYAPVFKATVRGVTTELDTHLDTYLVDADRRRVELTWRACLPVPRKTDEIEAIRVYGVPALSDALIDELARRVSARGLQEKSP